MASNLQSRGREFNPRPVCGSVTTLGKLFIPCAPDVKQYNLVPAKAGV